MKSLSTLTCLILIISIITVSFFYFLKTDFHQDLTRDNEIDSLQTAKSIGYNTQIINHPTKIIIPNSIKHCINGKVINKITNSPIQAYEIEITWVENNKTISHLECIQNREGDFSFGFNENVSFDLNIFTSDHIPFYRKFNKSDDINWNNIIIELDPGIEVTGSIIDFETEKPIQNVILITKYSDMNTIKVKNRSHSKPNCVTDQNGVFSLKGLSEKPDKLIASHNDYAIQCVDFNTNNLISSGKNITIRLKKGYLVSGKVLGINGKPVNNVKLIMSKSKDDYEQVAFTNKKGKYEFNYASPGDYMVTACSTCNQFIEEQKLVTIHNTNKEVIFGTGNDFVTWYGTLYDKNGTNISNAQITLLPSENNTNEYSYSLIRKFKTNQNGDFKILKLPVGTYNISVRVKDINGSLGIDVAFDEPGKINKDLILYGDEVQGCVINGSNKREITKSIGYLSCCVDIYSCNTNKTSASVRQRVKCNEFGEFSCKWLKPGKYELYAYANMLIGDKHTIVYSTKQHLKLKKNHSVIGLLVPIEVKGILVVKLNGFNDSDLANSEILMIPTFKSNISYDRSSVTSGNVAKLSNNQIEYETTLAPGAWTFRMLMKDSGDMYIKNLIINPNEIEIINISNLNHDKMNTNSTKNRIKLKGKLTDNNGIPLEGCPILISAIHGKVPSECNEKHFDAFTDENGEFTINGLSHGSWYLQYKNNETSVLSSLNIPLNSGLSYDINLIISKGVVKGNVLDNISYETIKNYNIKVSNALWPYDKYSSKENLKTKGFFSITGLPPGKYLIEITSNGYEPFTKIIRVYNDDLIEIDPILMQRTSNT